MLGYATTLEVDKEALLERTDTLGDTWEEQSATGNKRGALRQEGFYDDGTNASNAALVGNEGLARVTCIGLEGNTLGKKFIGMAGPMQINHKRIASRGELHKANSEYAANGEVEEGTILHTHKAETAAGDTEGADSQDAGASSANGGAGYLEVSALTLGGYTSVTAKIRHSADDITYADLVTFANVTAAPTAERKTVAGTVNRHLACSWALNGTGSGPSITFMIGFVRN